MCEAMRLSVQTAHDVQHCVQLYSVLCTVYNCTVYFVPCTVVQSDRQEIDSHMFHMSTSWSEDLVSCQFLSDLRTSNILYANKSERKRKQ